VNPALSVWLDLCRVIAAGVVFVGHARGLEVAPAALAPHWHRTAEDAVIAFFVISGFVIAWSARRPGTGLRDYVEARASRVFSVAIPAVLATVAIDHVGMRLDSSFYSPDWQYPKLWLYLPFHWSFLGGTWFGAIDPFSMASYWSLPYEVW
jgi:peptidoglycan/LPS O-acetylase OafA/YrhL